MRIGTVQDVAEHLGVRVERVYQQAGLTIPCLPRTGPRLRFDMDRIEVEFPKRPLQMIGDVYFIQAVGGGPIKIGMTTNLDRRLHDLQFGSPIELRVLAVWKGGGEWRELGLHQRFAGARLHGEWFEPTAELLSLIESVKEAMAA